MLRGVHSSNRKEIGTDVSGSTWAVLTEPQKFQAMASSADIVHTVAAGEEEEEEGSLVKSALRVMKAVHA
jgi:hypothetical protein